jgi:hypothetical protein
MRTVFAILLCVLAMSRDQVSALRQIAAWTAQSATPGLPSTTQTPPRPSPSGSVQKAAPSTPATAALRCIQNALGGTKELAALSSVRFIGNTKPRATTRPRPYAKRIEIGMVFPDRFKLQTVQTDAPPGLPPLSASVGFNGEVLLANPRVPDFAVPKVMPRARQEFVRQMLMRLPRELAGVRLSQRVVRDAGQERLAIDAFSPALVATLLADVQTCMPIALEYTTVSMAEGSDTYRVDLSEYRRFGGIRFPTLLRKAKNGEAWEDEYDVNVEVNASFDDRYFRQ